jgi:peptidoglycan/LPS O-acetylase OafA/YrhL
LTIDTLPGVETPTGNLVIVNGSLWTLYFEVLCYASLVMISLSGILARRAWTAGIFLTVYAFNALLWYSGSFQALVPGRIVTFASLFVYFAAGVCIYRLSDAIPWSGIAAMAAALCILAGLPIGVGVLVMPLCLPYLVVYLGLSRLLGERPYRHDFSYGIYVFQGPVLAFMLVMLPSLRNFLLALPIIALVSLSMAMLSWTYVESPALSAKNGWLRWSASK